MKVLETKQGFYMYMFGKDCFIETSQTKKSKRLAMEFVNAIQHKRNKFHNITDGDLEYVMYCMDRATLELREFKKGRDIEIHGELFGGHGTNILPFEINPYDEIYFCVDNGR